MAISDEVMLRAWFPAICGVGASFRSAALRPHLSRIDHCARPVQLSGAVKLHKEDFKYLLEHPRVLPLLEAMPTGYARTTQFDWHIFPGNACAQDEHDTCKGNPVGGTRTSSPLTRRVRREH